jgi:polysaccharide export outer membrane protein
MLRWTALFCCVALSIILFAGCVSQDAEITDAGYFSSTGSRTMRVAELSSGDTIEVSVEVDGRKEVSSHEANVNHMGYVTLPLVGDVHIGGVGIDVARSVITQRYQAYYVSDPVVMVTMAGGWGQVSVLGRVEIPGPVELTSGAGIRLSAAIQEAGGFAPSANTSKVQVTRMDRRGRKLRVIVDFDEIGQSGNADEDLMLFAGDIVNVPERYW